MGRKKVKREIRYCKCGCEYSKELRITDKWQYKKGHGARIVNPTPKGSHRSDDVKKKISITNSKKVKELWKNKAYREKHVEAIRNFAKNHKEIYANPWNKGKKLSKEHCKKLSKAHRGQSSWNKGLIFIEREIRYCECGCGIVKEVKVTSKWRMCAGHNLKNPENNPAWLGGRSHIEYGADFTKDLKENLKKRDKYKCQICENNNKLAIHHIDYNKHNNNEFNLITLCNRCHAKTNHNRQEWQKLLTKMLGEIYCEKNINNTL